MPKVLFMGDIHPAGHALFDSRPEFEKILFEDPTRDDLMRNIGDADAVIVRKIDLRADAIAIAPNLKIASRHGVGCDNIDVALLTERGVPVTVVGDANSTPVAEHAMMLLLSAARRLPRLEAFARSTDPSVRDNFIDGRNYLDTVEVAGKTILIVGFGRIGRKLSRRCAAFDMKVVVADPFVPAEVVQAEGYDHVADFKDALGAADALILALPADPKAPPIIQAPEFAVMKKGLILINVARGTLVDYAAAAEAVKNGTLFNIGVDVWEHMPPDPDHPLLGLPDAVLTPHVAALTEECMIRMARVSVQNIFDFFDGRLDPKMVFNPDVLKNN